MLFGADLLPIDPAQYRVYFRLLESNDEYFSYSSGGPPAHGRWNIAGLGLDRAVLEQVYAQNARRVLGITEDWGQR